MNPVLALRYKLIALLCALLPVFGNAQSWTTLITDAQGDGSSATMLDATKFEYLFDANKDSIFFRITTDGITQTQSQNFGVNIMVALQGYPTFSFWGPQNTDKWSKLFTVWVNGTPPSDYSGTIGIANFIGVQQSNFKNIDSNNIDIIVDTATATIVLGMRRTDFVTNIEMAGGSAITMRIAAAVGSSSTLNDDIYSPSATLSLTGVVTAIPAVWKNPTALVLYPNPAHDVAYVSLPDEAIADIDLIDITGKQIKGLKIDFSQATQARISTQTLAQGMYWLTVTDAQGGLHRQKLAVVK